MQAQWYEFLSAGQNTESAAGGFQPQVDLRTRYGYEWRDYGPNSDFTGADGELTLRQMLYDGFATSAEVERLNQVQLVNYYELLSEAENVALEAFRAFQNVARQQKLVRLAKENLQRHHEVFDQIKESVEAGVSRSVDLEQINGRVALAESNLNTEMSNLHDAKARYLRIVGSMPQSDIERATIDQQKLPSSLKRILEQAYQSNPAFYAALRNIQASKQSVEQQKASFHPQLDLTASYGSQNYDNLGFSNGRSDARIGLELSYNLYRGGSDQAELRRRYEQVNVAKSQRDKECVDLRQTAQIAFNDVMDQTAQLPMLNRHRLASDRVRTAYRNQFDLGQRTLLDVLDAENEHFEASRAYVNAKHEIEIARARTLAAMGQLLAKLNVQRDGLPTLAELDSEKLTVDGDSACPAINVRSRTRQYHDDDGDGVPRYLDFCPETPQGHVVDSRGCTVQEKHERVFDSNTQFERGKASVAKEDRSQLKEVAAFIASNPEAEVLVEGHASKIGAASFNQQLSQERAQTVANLLVNKFGIDEARLKVTGYGEGQPLREGDSAEAHKANQRVEVRVVAEKKRPKTRGSE